MIFIAYFVNLLTESISISKKEVVPLQQGGGGMFLFRELGGIALVALGLALVVVTSILFITGSRPSGTNTKEILVLTVVGLFMAGMGKIIRR